MPISKSEESWLESKRLVEEQRSSGLSARKWCLQNQIHPSTFHSWVKKIPQQQLQKSSFTELVCKQSNEISLQMRGFSIHIGEDCDPALRKRFFNLLAEWAC